MIFLSYRGNRAFCRTGVTLLGAAFALSLTGTAKAQGDDRGGPSPALRQLGNFISTGGYFLTGSSGKQALGDVKFYNDLTFYTRPRQIGGFTITGGAQYINASDHFFPFSGGSHLTLIGPSVRLSIPKESSSIRPYVNFGLFYGQVRSERLGFDRSNFTPSAAIGVEWQVARYVRINADYRISQQINGTDINGFSLSLRLF